MRTILLLGAGTAVLGLAGCAARPVEATAAPDAIAASPGGPSSTGLGVEDRPLPTPAPGTGPLPDQRPSETPGPGPR